MIHYVAVFLYKLLLVMFQYIFSWYHGYIMGTYASNPLCYLKHIEAETKVADISQTTF